MSRAQPDSRQPPARLASAVLWLEPADQSNGNAALRHLLTFTAALLAPMALHAAEPSADDALPARAADVAAVLMGQRAEADVFTPGFVTAVPEDKLKAIVTALEAAHGKVTGADEVKPAGNGAVTVLIRFERANGGAVIQLEAAPPFRVAGFRITSVTPVDDGPQEILADFAALPGRAGFALVRLTDQGPQPVLSARPAEQFAIGSTFKLWVLDALAESIARGEHRWDEVIRLDRPRSWPSGMSQDWPEDAPVTLETLATMMIAISDNNATDRLIRLLGREAIGARVRATGHSAPDRILPLLTTREAFGIKADPALAARYARADEAGQAKLLVQLDAAILADRENRRPPPREKPAAIDSVEWFASAQDVAGVLDSLRRRADPRVRAVLAVSPGIAATQKTELRYAGYKGGSEPGVINLSWLLQAEGSGNWYALSASWNNADAPVENSRFEQLAQRIIALVK